MKWILFNVIAYILYVHDILIVTAFQVSNTCPNGLIYDSRIYSCTSCATNKIPDENQENCICNQNYIQNVKNTNLTNIILPSNNQITQSSCSSCPLNTTASIDREICMKCPGEIDSSTNDCICDFSKEILVEDREAKIKTCFTCPDGSLPNPFTKFTTKYECISCPSGMEYQIIRTGINCVCKNNYVQAGSICLEISSVQNLISLFPQTSARSITYKNIDSSSALTYTSMTDNTSATSSSFSNALTTSLTNSINSNYIDSFTISSDLINEIYLNAAYKCISENINIYCQQIANICVLQLYDIASTACRLYNEINNSKPIISSTADPGSRQEMPWIYYKNNSLLVINNESAVPFDVSIDKSDPLNYYKLDFFLYVYNLEGDLLRVSPLTDQLVFCSKRWEDAYRYREFQTSFENNCEIDINKLLLYTNNTTIEFYEIFLKDYSKSDNKLIDIPILIDNIPNSIIPGKYNNETDISNWIITRRFFLVDILSGIQGDGNYKARAKPLIIRYASSIKLVITLQNISNPKIYPPYIEIYYSSKLVSSIVENQSRPFSFTVSYSMDITSFQKAMLGILITFVILTIIAAGVKTNVWRYTHPKIYNPGTYIIRLFLSFFTTLLGFFGKTMFWFLFFISLYWFAFFKLQYRIYLLLPPFNEESFKLYYEAFFILFYVSFGVYSLYMINLIFSQCSFEIFFIDWEHDKEVLRKNLKGEKAQKYKGAWRMLNLINQFHELETYKYYSSFFAFSILIFAWYYLEWGQHTTLTPNLTKTPKSPQHFMLRYFVCKFVLIIVGIGYYLWQFVMLYFYPFKSTEFIDLCVLSNISVLILDDTFHGYYIHGQAPSGKSDEALDVLNDMLHDEAQGRYKPRGLSSDNDTCETYEIYISNDFRDQHDSLFNLQTNSKPNRKINETEDDYLAQKRYFDKFHKYLNKVSREEKMNTVSNLKKLVNAELKEKIVRVFAEPSKYVKDMSLMQRFFGMPSIEIIGKTRKDIVFFKEKSETFKNVIFSGIEWQLYIWWVYWFMFIFLLSDSVTLSAFISFLIDLIVIHIREYYGEKNLSKWSMTDDRFII